MNLPEVPSTRKVKEQFSRDLEILLQTGSLPVHETTSGDYLEMLQLAGRLSKMDPSQSSSARLALREHLAGMAESQMLSGAPAQARSSYPKWGGQVALAGRWVLAGISLVVLILGLFWIFSGLVPSLRQEPAAAGTPLPLATDQPVYGPTPLPSLGQDTPIEEIVDRMSFPLWKTIWLNGTVMTEGQAGQPQKILVQAWIDRDGRGRVLSSDPIPLDRFDPQKVSPHYLWISNGSGYSLFDLQTGQPADTSGLFSWMNHPLENAGPLMELIFPYYITGRDGAFRNVGQFTLANRVVLIVEWRPFDGAPLQDRFWVDIETGQILRRQILGEDEVTVVKDFVIDAVVYDIPFPQNLAGMAGLESARFTGSPQEILVPGDYLPLPEPVQPTLFPQPQVDIGSSKLTLLRMDDPLSSGEAKPGDLYLSKRVYSEESDVMIRLPGECLQSGSAACPVEMVEYPSLAWSPLYWSPDGFQAAHLDTDHNRLLLFDPQAAQWQTLVDPFLSNGQWLFWSPDSAWIAASVQDEGRNGSLVMLVRADGSGQQVPAPELGGMQSPVGWLDVDRLLLMSWKDVQKGQAGQATVPILYEVNLATGGWYPIPLELGRNAVTMIPVLSPDKKRLVVPINGGSGWSIYSLGSGELSPLTDNGMNPTWSPDGQWIALVQPVDGVYQVNLVRADGSETRKVFEWVAFPVVTWSQDGKQLVIEASPAEDQPAASLFVLSLQEGILRQLIMENEPGSYELRHPSFRP